MEKTEISTQEIISFLSELKDSQSGISCSNAIKNSTVLILNGVAQNPHDFLDVTSTRQDINRQIFSVQQIDLDNAINFLSSLDFKAEDRIETNTIVTLQTSYELVCLISDGRRKLLTIYETNGLTLEKVELLDKEYASRNLGTFEGRIFMNGKYVRDK
jgi:hypothetical protein